MKKRKDTLLTPAAEVGDDSENGGCSISRWEYCSAQLEPVFTGFAKMRGWRLKAMNEQEQPGWETTAIYPSVTAFCHQMDERGWDLASVAYPDHRIIIAIVYFKRLCL